MEIKLRRYDVVNYLEDELDVEAYLEAIGELDDPALMASALGDVARARNMSQLARDTGLTRAGLTKALGPDGNPSFATITKVAKALGLRVAFVPAKVPQAAE